MCERARARHHDEHEKQKQEKKNIIRHKDFWSLWISPLLFEIIAPTAGHHARHVKFLNAILVSFTYCVSFDRFGMSGAQWKWNCFFFSIVPRLASALKQQKLNWKLNESIFYEHLHEKKNKDFKPMNTNFIYWELWARFEKWSLSASCSPSLSFHIWRAIND